MKKIFTLAVAALATSAFASIIETVPASADQQTWSFNATRHWPTELITNRSVQVAIDGNDIYLSGLNPDITTWVKGTLSNGSYVFATGQQVNNVTVWGTSCQVALTAYDEWGNASSSNIVATFADNTLTFTTMFGFTNLTYVGNEFDWWEAGATVSKSFEEPSTTEETATLPYKNDFDSESKRSKVSFYPNNETGWLWGCDWETNNWYATCNNDGSERANDYLFLPGLPMEAGKHYIVSFKAQSSSSNCWQNYEVLMAPDAKLSQYTDTLIANGLCFSTSWENVEQEFTIADNGTYYLAIHCSSNAYNGYLSIDNIAVEVVDTDKPVAASNVSVTPGQNGALSATVNFTMPTANIGGQNYDSNKVLGYKVTRGEYIIEEGSAKAGDMKFVSDGGMGLTNGNATYKVVISDGTHVSKEAEASAFIGIDYPTETEYVEISNEGNQVTIAWVPVTKGANGGYVGAKYNVYACPAKYQQGEKLNEEPLTQCAFTFEYDVEAGEQGDAWFCVTAVNEVDESYGTYESLAVGAPYELPFTESFAGNSHVWNLSGNGGDAYIDSYGSFSSDEDGTSLCFYLWNGDTEASYATATTGKIKTAAKATLSFDYKAEVDATLKIYLCTKNFDDEDAVLLTDEPLSFVAGSQSTVSVSNLFDKVLNRSFARIAFVFNTNATYQSLYLDNMKIEAEPTPAVSAETIEVTTGSFKMTFTPNEVTDKYYCCLFNEGELEEQFNMWSGFMGFNNYGDMVKGWGVACMGVQTKEWKDLAPSTNYEVYVLPVDATGEYGELQCFTVTTESLGGPGASVITIEVGDFGGDDTNGHWQIVTYTPNDQTAVFFDLICTDEFYQENGAEGVKAYLMEEADTTSPYFSYYAHYAQDVAQWNAEPATTYHACAIGKNANGEWGEMAEVIFTTPGSTAIQNVEEDKMGGLRYNLQGLQTQSKKGMTILNGRLMLVR